MTTLIVNADDYGLSESVNRGIVDAHVNGIVTSTTWLAGGDAADAAVEQTPPQLEVGLHLALTEVRPVGDTAPFRTLLDAAGRWPSGFGAVVRWMMKTSDAGEAVAEEWRAQINRFMASWSRLPSHLDSHQHIGLIPGLMTHVVELAAEYDIPAVRVPCEVRSLSDWLGPHAFHRPHETVVLSALAAHLRGIARRVGVSAPASFAGFRQSGRMSEAFLLDLMPRLVKRSGPIELMVHPGSADEPGRYLRRQERNALISPRVRAALETHGLQLGRFADLP